MLVTALALSILFSSAISAAPFSLSVSEPTLKQEFPSASGVIVNNEKIYAVGDDSPYLFTISNNFDIDHKELIKHYPTKKNGRILKKVKPDFEAMDEMSIHGEPSWVILGSGSKADVREWAFVIDFNQQTKIERSLKPLYRQLYQASGFSGKQELNIEGLASSDKSAFIFNRGNSGSNVIFEIALNEFHDYLTGKSQQVSNIKAYHVTLPTVDGFEAGLSGAEYWPETDSLIYTASIEATGDAYNDGDILGSFVGVVKVDQLHERQDLDLRDETVPLLKEGKRVITKVESVGIAESSLNQVKGVLVSDNDDGTSELFDFTLER